MIVRLRPQPVSPRVIRLAPVAVLAWVALAGAAQPASAAVPCWKKLLNDWYQPPINNVYPIPCYHQAIKQLPTDVSVYSSARDDILRALQRAIGGGGPRPAAGPAQHGLPMPLPLVVLGSLALLLLLAGAFGLVRTRRRASPRG